MYVITINNCAYRADSMDTIKDAFMAIEENVITDEFGTGEKEFLCDSAGVHAPAAIAIIHANSMEHAIKLRAEYFKQRIEQKTIILGSVWEIYKSKM